MTENSDCDCSSKISFYYLLFSLIVTVSFDEAACETFIKQLYVFSQGLKAVHKQNDVILTYKGSSPRIPF